MTSKKNRLSYSFLMTCNIFVILKVYPVQKAKKYNKLSFSSSIKIYLSNICSLLYTIKQVHTAPLHQKHFSNEAVV